MGGVKTHHYPGDTCLGPEGVPCIEVLLYLFSVKIA